MARPSIFITGAAAGIGRATAELFVAEGWLVGAYDVDQPGLAALKQDVGTSNLVTGVLDVRDVAAWEREMVEFFAVAGGRLDVLVNNAGILYSGPFENITPEQHHRLVDVNIKGVINGCHAALPYLRRTPNSRVINMASAGAIYGHPSLASYSASKFAVRALTEALDLEWDKYGVKVRDVWPLYVSTAMVDNLQARSIKTIGVTLTAEDVAQTILRMTRDAGGKVHWPVGWRTHVLASSVKLLPDRINRLLTRWTST
jgi:NAD(P)-dependent dehydrogenase (short-subunit alcohol dehydrogenase family)